MRSLAAAALAALLAGGPRPVAAAVIPPTRAAWEKLNPLGGEFEGGRYAVLHEEAPAFEVARGFAPSSNLVIEAAFTPERDIPGEGNAALAIWESPGRYWHLFLSKGRSGVRRFGLTPTEYRSQLSATAE